ncbi:MAG: hypothetical protein HS128_23135 [Ideonella sp.]|nr:hypothetical protein [Ideonella sp.]MCC7457255.1 hypothetical protein [Nitrospira sp.]
MRCTSRTRWLRFAAALSWTVAAAAAADDGNGLTVNAEQLGWPHWRTRLQVSSELAPVAIGSDALLRPRSAAVFGDYYMARPYFGPSGGLRLTGGLMMSVRGAALGPGLVPAVGMIPAVAPVGRSALVGWSSNDGAGDAISAWPYLGIGYSDSVAHGGLRFSADLGLALPGQNMLRAARSLGSQSFDDVLRDLRLTPVLQLGVSYRF